MHGEILQLEFLKSSGLVQKQLADSISCDKCEKERENRIFRPLTCIYMDN